MLQFTASLNPTLDCVVALACISLSFTLYARRSAIQDPNSASPPAPAYVLENSVNHTRLLPVQSTHSFTYPTLCLLLSLPALESHSLDLGAGWIFSYGGIWARLTGIRSKGYLMTGRAHDTKSIRQKLSEVLDDRGFDSSRLGESWIMTMPSFLGVEGINPLTVHFCYDTGNPQVLWLVLLEIHNTFGERHVHVLEVGKRDYKRPPRGFDHQWTFPREFHVSPFNDRSGYYICSIVEPTHPPPSTRPCISPSQAQSVPIPPPRPIVKLNLVTASSPPQLKLTAVFRPVTSRPLTTLSLFHVLARAPFALLITLPRILYEASKLHFHKRLDVFARPEPRARDIVIENAVGNPRNWVQATQGIGGGIKWQDESGVERWARLRVERFLQRRAQELNVIVKLVSTNPDDSIKVFSPLGEGYHGDDELDGARTKDENNTLALYYRSPKFFTTLLISLSPSRALELGSAGEGFFSCSSTDLFQSVFHSTPDQGHSRSRSQTWISSAARAIRLGFLPSEGERGRVWTKPDQNQDPIMNSKEPLDVPQDRDHPLDQPQSVSLIFILMYLLTAQRLEKAAYRLSGARFVRGDEPWAGWERASGGVPFENGNGLGSVRTELELNAGQSFM